MDPTIALVLEAKRLVVMNFQRLTHSKALEVEANCPWDSSLLGALKWAQVSLQVVATTTILRAALHSDCSSMRGQRLADQY